MSRRGIIRIQTVIICSCHRALHGMTVFMHAVDRNSQHDHEEKFSKEF